jgi:hypothetical protein
VGERTGELHVLLLVGDGGGLDGADPDRQVPVAFGLFEQDHGLVAREFHADPDYGHHPHRFASNGSPCS